jgi:hypothetical protein
VIIKVLRHPHPRFQDLVNFRNQYIISQALNHANLVKPLALECCDNGYALVMADRGAIDLSHHWFQAQPSLSDFFHLAIQLVEVLHYLGHQGVLHKDIKPANILIDPRSHQVQLIDFSIASVLPQEQQALINPRELQGTLAYMSPEQTGRMNRGIDYRTDFYSLGATFFHLLTGQIPFRAPDAMGLVHCHLAQAVAFPTQAGHLGPIPYPVPTMVQQLVRKLMAKNPEDRYQSALGLKHDLQHCLGQWETQGAISPFNLAEQDRCDRFLIPEKLYGREREVQTLLQAFERVAVGSRELLLVAGFSGIGKTAVVNEVHRPITRQQGYFIRGKFDQFNRNLPFSGFIQAFRSLMGQLLGESDQALAHWRGKILGALGNNGQVLIEVIPELERIIGAQPPVPHLSGGAAQNRFNLLFDQFVQVFAMPEHPLVIFLDDLQWIDSASLNLLQRLFQGFTYGSDVGLNDGPNAGPNAGSDAGPNTSPNADGSGHLLVLGAYRDNEVFPAHPLMLTTSPSWWQKPCCVPWPWPSPWPSWCSKKPRGIPFSPVSFCRNSRQRGTWCLIPMRAIGSVT